MHLEPSERSRSTRDGLRKAGLLLPFIGVYLGVFPWANRPLVDTKVLLIAAGAVLLWASKAALDRRLLLFGTVFLATQTLATVTGVDPLRSLTGSADTATGLVLWTACLYLMAAGPGMRDLLEWIADRLVLLGFLTASISLAARMFAEPLKDAWPTLAGILGSGGGGGGALMGNPLWVVIGLCVAFAALLSAEARMDRRVTIAVALIMGAALGATGQYSLFLLPVVALAAFWLKSRPVPWSKIWVAALLMMAASVTFTLSSVSAPAPADPGAKQIAPPGANDPGARLQVWEVHLRSFAQRPISGWGPDNAWGPFVANASLAERKAVGRGWSDAHNLPLQVAVTSGLIGLLGFIALAIELVRRIVRTDRERGWAVGAAAACGVMALYEPIFVTLTPLLLLTAGLAVGERRQDPDLQERTWVRGLVGTALIASLVLTTAGLTSATLQRWGAVHRSATALSLARSIQPWRQDPGDALAQLLAESGAPADGARARSLAFDEISMHPWDPMVYVNASWILNETGDPQGASELIEEHVQRFPNDETWVLWILSGSQGVDPG